VERVGILSTRETKELIKKRRNFEYKLQKRSKDKKDFLEYIQYEENLLKLIAIRRENIGYQHKKSEIEGAMRTRINKLFRILEHRFQSDVTVWLSHLEFLQKQAGWEAAVSKVYLRMLQVHSDKPALWVAAAKYEFEEMNNPDNGRQIMLRGLRFLPSSQPLHLEYLKLELLYVEQLRKRAEVLGREGLQAKESLDDLDSVLDCGVVKLVLSNAMEAVENPQFFVSLLCLLQKFPFAKSLADEVLTVLRTKHFSSPVTWDTVARKELEVEERSLRLNVQAAFDAYIEGLEKVKEADKELFELAISTFKELAEASNNCLNKIMTCLSKLLDKGLTEKLLSVQHFKFWIQLLDIETDEEFMLELIEEGVNCHKNSVDLWIELIVLNFKISGEEGAEKCLKRGLKELNSGPCLSRLWEVALKTVSPLRGWELLTGSLLDSSKPELRLLHLEYSMHRGLEMARETYQGYANLPPFSRDIHLQMFQFEKEELKVNYGRLRTILGNLCSQFGKSDPSAWIAWIKIENEAGNPIEAAKILCRAENTLESDLRKKLILMKDDI